VVTTMGLLAPQKAEWPRDAYTAQQIMDRLTLWREHLIEHKHGTANAVLTHAEITGQLDRWLDELLDIQGR